MSLGIGSLVVGQEPESNFIAEGDSAYEVAVRNGFTGTEQDWLTSLNGITGAQAPFFGPLPPQNPVERSLWVNSNTLQQFVWYYGAWVELIASGSAIGPQGPQGERGPAGTSPDGTGVVVVNNGVLGTPIEYSVTNRSNTIVQRDAEGNFSASVITAALNGNAATATRADSAATADSATNALNAMNASHALSATNATSATSAETAARLTNPRSINGVAFDGSADISVSATPTDHSHGQITSSGRIGIFSGRPIITAAGGELTTGAFGNIAGTFCSGNDERLFNARAPLSHQHGNITNEGAIGATANLPIITGANGVLQAGSFGTAAGTFCQGNDSRLLGGGVPTGAVMAFAANSVPANWLAANGAAVSRSVYAGLFASIGVTYGAGDSSTTFNLPDLRGYFVRGSGANSDGTVSGAFGAKQADSFKSHTHSITQTAHSHNYYDSYTNQDSGGGGGGGSSADGAGDKSRTTGAANAVISINAAGDTETRPKNIAMLYCIKF